MSKAATLPDDALSWQSRQRRVVTVYLPLLCFVFVLLFPFYWMTITAIKPNAEMFSMPPTLVGSELRWSNFVDVFAYGPFLTYIMNSFIVAIGGTLVVLIVSTTAGYAFGRLRWKGRDAVFVLFLATLMVPAEVLVIPMFQVMQWFNWVDTYQALILPFAFGAFGTFLMRQFFRGIPYELEEAARVDGAGPVRSFLQIILPLSKSAVAVLAVFTFLSFWNSYLWPLIVLSPQNPTLQTALSQLQSGYYIDYSIVLAGAVLATLPLLVLFVAAGRQLVSGIMAGAVKG